MASRSCTFLEILFAIILPPLGVFLHYGCCSGRRKQMERYFSKKPASANTSTTVQSSTPDAPRTAAPAVRHNSAVPELIDLDKLPRDPSKRKRMADYHPNQRDQIRRKYLTWGPHQPRGFNFPYKLIGKKQRRRRFNPDWFDQYANWIEYSEKTDKAYCLCCYLFRDNVKDNHHGHYRTLLGLSKMFSSAVKVLEYVEKDGSDPVKRRQANGLLKYFQTFDSVFFLHMMMMILALTNGLSKTLQRKDKDIVNAISDVESTKRELKKLRTNEGWSSLMEKVTCFCEKHGISIVDMEKEYVNPKKTRQKTGINNEHHYRVDCFFVVLDQLGEEFDNRFNEVNSELLGCMSALSPSDLFCQFDKEKLVQLAKFYPDDFNHKDMVTLEHELSLYIDNVLHDTRFSSLDSIGDLAKLMVDTRKHLSYPLVFQLLKLVLTLPVATATVERCFSAMKIVKTALRNKIGDEYLSNSLICYIEKVLLDTITNEAIVDRFHKKNRRGKM